MNVHDSSGFVIRNSQINWVGGHQITVHRYGSITNGVSDTETDYITVGEDIDTHSIPRLSQNEVPLLDDSSGITVYGRDTLFHARLRPLIPGRWAPGGTGDDATRVVVRKLARESSDEDVDQEIRQSLNYYYPYVMQLFGASRRHSPNKFLVYSNPNVNTYTNFHVTQRLRGDDYRRYDAQYDLTFNSAWKYLKTEVPVDGFTLDIIFSETRTVSASQGSALIIVPALPSSPIDRTKLVIKVLEEFKNKVTRRIEASRKTQYTRCPECLPSIGGWNQGLLNSVLRCVGNVRPHLEWGKFLVENGSEGDSPPTGCQQDSNDGQGGTRGDSDDIVSEFTHTLEKANRIIDDLRENTEDELNKAMMDLVIRSRAANSGICLWCGKEWERKTEIDGLSSGESEPSAVITVVEDPREKDMVATGNMGASLYALAARYRMRIIMAVICILLAVLFPFLCSLF